MAKSKSSASSATRKKHANKKVSSADLDHDDDDPTSATTSPRKANQPAQRGQKKVKKDRFAPKVKSYVPPPPPPKGAPDPVDVYGLGGGGGGVDPELVVVLRKLGKRDEGTIGKGVEGLEGWVQRVDGLRVGGEDDDGDGVEEWEIEQKGAEVVRCMDVWAHHFPLLSLHPSRKLRLQTLSLHLLLTTPTSPLFHSTRSALLSPTWIDNPEYIGSLCVAGRDSDRAVRNIGKKCWDGLLLPSSSLPDSDENGKTKEEQETREGITSSSHAESISGFAINLLSLSPSSSPPPPPTTPSKPKQKYQSPEERASAEALLQLERAQAKDVLSAHRTQALGTLEYLLEEGLVTGGIRELVKDEGVWELLSVQRDGNGEEEEEAPGVRRAVYELLGAVVGCKEGLLERGGQEKDAEENEDDEEEEEEDDEDAVAKVAVRVLKNCWGEAEGWAGIIAFLRRYPEAWTLADSLLSPPPPDSDLPSNSAEPLPPPSPTLQLLFTYISTSCASQPHLFETLLLLLSTIPPSLLPPTPTSLHPLFSSFFLSLDSRSLNLGSSISNIKAKESWWKAFGECLVMEIGRLGEGDEDGGEVAKEWVGRLWELALGVGEDSGRRVGYGTRKNLEELRKVLERLTGREAIFAILSEHLLTIALSLFHLPLPASHRSTSLTTLSALLQTLSTSSSPSLLSFSHHLALESLSAASIELSQSSIDQGKPIYLSYIQSIRNLVEDDEEARERLNFLARKEMGIMLISEDESARKEAIDYLIMHLSSGSTLREMRDEIWEMIFKERKVGNEVLLEIVRAVQEGRLVDDLPNLGLEGVLLEALDRAVLGGGADGSGTSADSELVERLMIRPAPFIDTSTVDIMLERTLAYLSRQTTSALLISTSSPSLHLLSPPLHLLSKYTVNTSNAEIVISKGGEVSVFEAAYLVGECREDVPRKAVVDAKKCWENLRKVGGENLVGGVMEVLKVMVGDVKILASSACIVSAAVELISSSKTTSIDVLLPTQSAFATLRQSLRLLDPSPALSIIDPLISQSSDSSLSSTATFDASFLGSYTRTVLAALEVAARDHSWLRKNLWVLPHILLVGNVAKDEFALGGSTAILFGKQVDPALLQEIASASDGLASYVLSSSANRLDNTWHSKAVNQLRSKTSLPTESDDQLLALLDLLSREGREVNGVYARRMFRTVLHSTMRYAEGSAVDAERWLAFAQSLPEGSELANAVIFAVKDTLADSPRFQRYQNELASNISGIAPSAANTKGLALLRILLATAPPLDAPIIFLPQQRSMFLIQKIQGWIASDEDLKDEIHSAVAELFLHLAPIVQDLSGSHWELIFDIIESNLEIASWTDMTTYPALYHSCRLIAVVKDLAARNAELRSTAKARIDTSLELVRDLFVARPSSGERNSPQIQILEVMAELVYDLPTKLLTMGPSFDKLIHLLKDPSIAVQHSSYSLISRIAQKHIEELVVEVELDDSKVDSVKLPIELVHLLEARLDPDVLVVGTQEELANASTYLMAWLTAFKFFESASPRMKGAYLDQLRKDDIIELSFIPSVFGMLGLTERPNPIDMTPFNVDEFHLELLESIDSSTLPILASYVYFRSLQSVPSLLRSWWDSCKNRQLHNAVSTFTSRHFSPVLISRELHHLRDPSDPAGKQLRDNEDFTVKVAAGANEVKVVFVVDEQEMEIGLKVPDEFPLVGVEVRDVRKVGVNDRQWRAWLLAVQQVITAQNGLIADALSLFKRNVTLHFEGVEACAICYSVISVVDRSLPTKACRTCNNRFHAGCLFKWFSTSHGSSCPLCRSLF